jgi:hypothetical protein
MVAVGVMLGEGERGGTVLVAVADGVDVGGSDGVSVGVAVVRAVALGLGVFDAVAEAVLEAVAKGRGVKVGVELGVGLTTVGETRETRVAVGEAPHETIALETRTSSRNAANAWALPDLAGPPNLC